VLGIGGRPSRVIEPGIDPIFTPRAVSRFRELEPYVLSVSDVYPYKNFARLVEAFALLDRPDLRLVIAGRHVDEHVTAELERQIRKLGLDGRVVLLGAVPLVDMPGLYGAAECFVFPSLLESFGFPPLEAMACGVPVACARASVMPEVCGDAPLYFDPYDPADIASATARLLDDRELARNYCERGLVRAASFRWDEAGAALAELFRSV